MERTGQSHTPWHQYDWDAILSGQGTADRYYARPGLIRKDRLATLAPVKYHPDSVALRTYKELCAALQKLDVTERDCGTESQASAPVCFVLKKAHSSNASGIRFLTTSDVATIVQATNARAEARVTFKISRTLGWAGLAAAAAAAIAAAIHARKTDTTMRRGVLVAVVGAAMAMTASMQNTQETVAEELRDEFPEADKQGNQAKPTVWLLQRYINPWLHNDRKFHMRALLLCVGDLRAYVHEDVRLLLATEPFDVGREDGGRLTVHVTNMSANRGHSDYRESCQNLSLPALGDELASRIFAQILECLGATLSAVRNAGRRHFFTTANCWELFGVDLLVEHGTGRVFLLEANPSPSLAMYGGSGPAVRAQLLGSSSPLETIGPQWCELLIS